MKHEIYKPGPVWYLSEIAKLFLIDILLAYVLYRSLFGMFVVLPFLYAIFKHDLKSFRRKKKNSFKESFKKQIQIISGTLEAGYSLENAYIYASDELEKSEGCDRALISENKIIVNGLRCNRRIEELLYSLGKKSQIEDVKAFASLVSIANIYGGNMIMIIRRLAKSMEQRNEVEMEIETMVSAKKLEGNIMLVMPFIMLVYMRMTNGDYINFFYTTIIGRVIITVALFVTFIAGIIINKIVDIA